MVRHLPHIDHYVELRRTGASELERVVTLPFAPNTGYSFPVSTDSWHCVDPIPAGVPAHGSLTLIWYLDGAWLKLRTSAEQWWDAWHRDGGDRPCRQRRTAMPEARRRMHG